MKSEKDLITVLDNIANYDYEFDGKGLKGKIVSKKQMLKVINENLKDTPYRLILKQSETHVGVKLIDIQTGKVYLKNSQRFTDSVDYEELKQVNDKGNRKTKKHFGVQSVATYFLRILIGLTFNIDTNESEEKIKEKEDLKTLKKELLGINPQYKFTGEENASDIITLKKKEIEKQIKENVNILRNIYNDLKDQKDRANLTNKMKILDTLPFSKKLGKSIELVEEYKQEEK